MLELIIIFIINIIIKFIVKDYFSNSYHTPIPVDVNSC